MYIQIHYPFKKVFKNIIKKYTVTMHYGIHRYIGKSTDKWDHRGNGTLVHVVLFRRYGGPEKIFLYPFPDRPSPKVPNQKIQ